MITSTSTISAAGVAGESELAKLIRYGCQFELQVHQMAELSHLRAENIQFRREVEDGADAPGAGRQTLALAIAGAVFRHYGVTLTLWVIVPVAPKLSVTVRRTR